MPAAILGAGMLANFKHFFEYLRFKWWLPYRRTLALKRLSEFK